MSQQAHIQRSASPPLLSCLCRERLNSFDSTEMLLIWCWESAGSLSTLCFGFRRSLIKLRWGQAWVWVMMTNIRTWQKYYLGICVTFLFLLDSFPWCLCLSLCCPTTPCLMYMQASSLPNRGAGSILEGWWIHYLFTQTSFRHKQLKSVSFLYTEISKCLVNNSKLSLMEVSPKVSWVFKKCFFDKSSLTQRNVRSRTANMYIYFQIY